MAKQQRRGVIKFKPGMLALEGGIYSMHHPNGRPAGAQRFCTAGGKIPPGFKAGVYFSYTGPASPPSP